MGRVVVFGSLNLDVVLDVGKLPVPGATVIGSRLRTFSGGKGAIEAIAAARLGGDVAMVGRVGTDTLGDRLLTELSTAGVDVGGVGRDEGQPTGAAFILVDPRGRNQIAAARGANGTVGQRELDLLGQLLNRDALLVLQMECPRQVARDALTVAREQGARVLLHASPPEAVDAELIGRATTLVANEREATAIFGSPVTGATSAGRAALRATHAGANAAIVLLETDAILCADGKVHEIHGYQAPMVDRTGADSTFVGALAMGLSRQWDLRNAVRLANAARAAAAAKLGAQTSVPSLSELARQFNAQFV